MSRARLSIVGTAGRREAAHILSPRHWLFMLERAEGFIWETGHEEVTLVSGGAAWADHVAVALFLGNFLVHPELRDKIKLHLELYLPCGFSNVNGRPEFWDTKEVNFRTNPGGTANYYHRAFSKKLYGASEISLMEISHTIERGALGVVGRGFFDRNSKVAASPLGLAFTLGPGDVPADGGTLDTWKKAQALGGKWKHISLANI